MDNKDKRFEMRLPRDEYERLARMAAEREQSVASLLREAALALWPIKGEAPRAQVSDGASVDEIRRLARQRYAHLPIGLAERKVREELD